MAASTTVAESELKLDRNSWFADHPKLKEMQSWGYHEDEVQIQTKMLVYLDLCEAKNWWHVEIHSCDKLQMAYITGKPMKKSRHYQTVLPITTQTKLDMERLQEYLEHVPFPPKDNSSSNPPDQSAADDANQNITSADDDDVNQNLTAADEVSNQNKTAADDANQNIITLAIADSDSTIVYYRIASGFLPPELEMEETKEQKTNKHKRRKKTTTKDVECKDEMKILEEDKLDPFQEEEL